MLPSPVEPREHRNHAGKGGRFLPVGRYHEAITHCFQATSERLEAITRYVEGITRCVKALAANLEAYIECFDRFM